MDMIPINRHLTIFAVIVCQLFWNCTRPDKQDILSAEEKASLKTAIMKFNKAFEEGDVNTLSSMITADYQHTNGTSQAIDKASWLAYLEKRQAAIQSGKLVVKKYEMESPNIIYYGTTAVLTTKVLTVVEEQGETKTNEYRVTNFWVYQSNEWKRAGFHDGKIR